MASFIKTLNEIRLQISKTAKKVQEFHILKLLGGYLDEIIKTHFRNKKRKLMKTLFKISMILGSTLLLISSKCSTKSEAPLQLEQPSILLVLGVDISGTMQNYPELSNEQLSTICESLLYANTAVTICIGFIGNETDVGFKRLSLAKVPDININSTLSERGKQRKKRDDTLNANKKAIVKFVNDINLTRTNTQRTCLNQFSEMAVKLISEPEFKTYNKQVCLFTDGLEDCGTKTINISFPSDIALHCIGWKNSNKIQHAGESYEFVDMSGFISYIELINKSLI